MATRVPYAGPALPSLGLRRFFLSAALFAAAAIVTWMLVLAAEITLIGPFAPVDRHIHEMLFGYAGAVIVGFLFTAIAKWTGRMPARGAPLAMLPALWIAGRLAVAGVFRLGPVAVMVIDLTCLAAISEMIVREVVVGRNWRNLKVVVPALLFTMANAAFHFEAMTVGAGDAARRLGFAAVLFLIMLIGGRIIPSFTRNWLAKRGPGAMPVQVNRFEGAGSAVGALAMGLWTGRPEGALTAAALIAAALIAAACLHVARLARRQGIRGWRSPLLAMLHVSYACIPAGLAMCGAAALGAAAPAVGPRLLGIGAVGGMTLAVMMRASLGHAGRALEAGPWLTAAYVMVGLAAPARVFSDGLGLWPAAAPWTAGRAVFVWRLGPALALAMRGGGGRAPDQARRALSAVPHQPEPQILGRQARRAAA